MGEEVARSEQLMQVLLDVGACSRDVIDWPHGIEPDPIVVGSVPRGEIFSDTVLSLAITQASPGLVKRLIDEGADVQSKTLHSFNQPAYALAGRNFFQGITPLHIGSFYLNVAGVQVLLDYRGGDINIVDMVSSRDDRGSLPLHWAAGGPDRIEEDYELARRDITVQTIDTFRLLLAPDPTTINARDDQGETALFWATRNYGSGGRKHFDILKFLCDNGADASVRDRNGQTPLHWLGFPRWSADPIGTAIIDLFLAYGAKIGDTDLDGNTPLHLAARCLDQVEAVRFLLSRGADVGAKNSKVNTPLHEVVDNNPYWMRDLGTTRDDNLRAQDEMLKELQGAGGNVDWMSQENAAGKTPLHIRDENRREWQEWDRKQLAEWRGMGRGREGSGISPSVTEQETP
jgi:ankyrin repeat protein